MIAWLGTGLLGGNFVRALRRRGEAVQVWNRSAEKARALEESGARACDSPAAAARGAARIHLTLSDDAAVDDVLERAREGFLPGVVIVDHTTTSPTGTAARARRRLPARARVHGPEERARVDRPHARLGRARPLRRPRARAGEDDRQARL